MPKKNKTKTNILHSALKLFNNNGLVNVRLQHIADEAFISVGNLAYHFPNKEAIVLGVYQELMKQQRQLLAEYRIVPLFDNMNRLFRQTFALQQDYRFFYQDTLEVIRAYPQIGTTHQEFLNWQISQLKSMLDFNAARGALLPVDEDQVFVQLAERLWMTIDFWLTERLVRGLETEEVEQYLADIWHLLQPYFSEMGKQEYRQMLSMPEDLSF